MRDDSNLDKGSGGTGGTTIYDQPATQAERRAMLLREASEPTCYHALAQGEDDLGGGGRWARPPAKQPPAAAWTQPVVPNEPPLGQCVDDLPDMRTVNGDNLTGEVPWEYGKHQQTPTEPDAAAGDGEAPSDAEA